MSVCVKQDGQLVKTAGLYSVTAPIGMADIYSTEEKEVGLWIDNKPLYQKSIMLDDVTIPQSGRVLIGLGTYISNIDNVIGGEVIVIDGNSNIVLPSFQIATMSQYGLTYTINKADGIVISRGSDSGAVTRDFIATVRYTKTTDTPWSGKFVPQGYGYISSGDIYSFEERQVGVWTDGKPLYMKSIDFDSIAKGTKTINHNIANIDQPIHVQWYFYYTTNNNILIGHEDSGSGYWAQVYYFTPTTVSYKLGTDWQNIGGLMATFYYTKTTDTSGSHIYMPQNSGTDIITKLSEMGLTATAVGEYSEIYNDFSRIVTLSDLSVNGQGIYFTNSQRIANINSSLTLAVYSKKGLIQVGYGTGTLPTMITTGTGRTSFVNIPPGGFGTITVPYGSVAYIGKYDTPNVTEAKFEVNW